MFDKAVIAHNNREKHINLHAMLISSMIWHPVIHYGMVTAHYILNIGRAINAGECTFYTNSMFNICENVACLLCIQVGKR